MKGGKQYNGKADLLEAIKTIIFEIASAEVKKSTRLMDDEILRKRVTTLKYKGFQVLYTFLICSIIGVDQFLIFQ